MPPDATETKRRILAAARDEFARFGLAGARVDRIAEKARANKRSIYVHFGTKEELFDIIAAQNLRSMVETAPFDAHALPESSAALYDMLQASPDTLRLTVWALLERQQPIASEVDAYRQKIDEVREAQREGLVRDDHDPMVLLAMLIALVTSWSLAPWSLRAVKGTDDLVAAPDGFRRSLIEAIQALIKVT